MLVASLKSSAIFVSDLSRAVAVPHELDFLELARYRGEDNGEAARLLKDLDTTIEGRHVLVVQDVVDTGLTLNYLVRMLLLRMPESLSAATLLDRPVPPARRRPPAPLRRLHRPGRVLRRVRLRPGRALARPARPAPAPYGRA